MHEDVQFFHSDLNLPFVIEMAGISYCDGTYRIRRQQADVTVLEYVVSGRGTVRENERTFEASAGDVYLLHQNCRHDYFSDARDPWIKIWFNIRGPVVGHLLQGYQLHQVNLVRACGPAIKGLFDDFLQAARASQPHPVIFSACALIFHRLLMLLASQVQADQQILPNEVEVLQTYMKQHLCEKITLADLARSIFRSKSYTVRVFKAACRQTPYAWLSGQRVEAARQLLAETNLPVKNIADQLCYADQHYFSTVFHRSTGLSPRQYRKNHYLSAKSAG